MAEKKVPQRMCVACRQMKPKAELIRIVKNDNGVSVDLTGKINGRGFYLCKCKECFAKAKKLKGFTKNYGFSFDEIAEQLEKAIEQ